jgi:hypothetical protein
MVRLGYVSALTRAEYAIVSVQAAAPERKWRRVKPGPTDFFGKRSITSVFLPGMKPFLFAHLSDRTVLCAGGPPVSSLFQE